MMVEIGLLTSLWQTSVIVQLVDPGLIFDLTRCQQCDLSTFLTYRFWNERVMLFVASMFQRLFW